VPANARIDTIVWSKHAETVTIGNFRETEWLTNEIKPKHAPTINGVIESEPMVAAVQQGVS
jgi:hypothetical protein